MRNRFRRWNPSLKSPKTYSCFLSSNIFLHSPFSLGITQTAFLSNSCDKRLINLRQGNYDVALCNSLTRYGSSKMMQRRGCQPASRPFSTFRHIKGRRTEEERRNGDEKHEKVFLGVRCASQYMNPSSFLTDLLQSSCLKL